jgi:hypothetical protein
VPTTRLSDHPQFTDDRWVRFFAVMGSVMAITEGGGIVKDTSTSKTKLIDELRKLSEALKVPENMKRWNTATEITQSASDNRAHNFLTELQKFDHLRCRVNVTPYPKGKEKQAAEDRIRLEVESRTKMGVQIVLVGVHSFDTLRTAYPNYYSDTTKFFKELDVALHGRTSEPFTTNHL